MRIDKFVGNLGYGSRKDIVKYIKNGHILINDEICFTKEQKINFGDIITIGNEKITYKENIYLILNKPSGYISSTKSEGGHQSYLELLKDCSYSNIVNIVGRLDFDTTGLLFLTNNGDITHKILHPKKEIFKKYFVKGINPLQDKDIQKLENGVKIDDSITLPAKVEIVSPDEIFLSICEGRFHQIKKMFEAIGNEVVSLKRVSIGGLELGNLKEGKWRYLDENEIEKIFL